MTDYYPGSKMRAKTYGEQQDYVELPQAEDAIDAKPRTAFLKGKEVEFYTVGALAQVLNRKPVTIRKWETEGIIPKPTFIAPSPDKRGKRRLYTREQILGIKQIAREEGVLEPNSNGAWKSLESTEFRAKVLSKFRELNEAYKNS